MYIQSFSGLKYVGDPIVVDNALWINRNTSKISNGYYTDEKYAAPLKYE